MTGPYAAGILSSAPGLDAHPGLVAALASGQASTFQTRAVAAFVNTLDLAKQVELAKSSGAKLDLPASAKGFLDSIGVDYTSVDAARDVQHPPDPSAPEQQDRGFLASAGHFLGAGVKAVTGAGKAAISNPVTRPVWHALDRVADVAQTPLRMPMVRAGLGLSSDPSAAVEGITGMAERGYNSGSFFDQVGFYSHGEQVYSDLDPLRTEYGDEQVRLAQRYVEAKNSGDSDWFDQFTAGKTPDQIAGAMQTINDPKFQELTKRVDAQHMSMGRQAALGLGIDPVAHATVFKAVSGAADAAVSWYVDPTLVLGKAYKAYKGAKLGLESALDGEGVRRILDPANRNPLARQVQNGWRGLLEDAKVVGSGSAEDAAAAMARITARTPELVPLVGDITGESRVIGRTADGGWHTVKAEPLTTMDELTEHLVYSNALLRLGAGQAAAVTRLMPGAVSRWGYRATKGAAAGTATRVGLNRKGWIDLREPGAAAKVLPTPGDAAGGIMPDDVADHLAGAQARGEALFNQRRYGRYVAPSSRAGRSLAYFSPGAIGSRLRYSGQRLTNLLPTAREITYADPSSVDTVRRFALTYMPKAEANLLTARYAAADEAGRMAIARGVLVQTAHAAGLPASVSGQALLDGMLSDLDKQAKRVYSPAAGADTYTNPAVGEAVHAAMYPGQLDSGIRIPAFAEMQKAAAKVTLWDYTLRKPLQSQLADDVMSFLKPGWLTSFAGTERNVLEDWAGATLRGQAPGIVRARSAQAVRTGLERSRANAVLSGTFDDGEDARNMLQRVGGRLSNAIVVRQLRGLKASAHLAITDEETLAALADLGTDEVDAYVRRLAGDAHAAVLSPGEADRVDELTKAGFEVRKLNVKLAPAGYDLVPTDGGAGARAWAANLANRVDDTGLGHRVIDAITGPDLAAPVNRELVDAARRGGLNGELSRLGREGKLGPLQREYEHVQAGATDPQQFLRYADAYTSHVRAGVDLLAAGRRTTSALSKVDTAVPKIADALHALKRGHTTADTYDNLVSKVDIGDPVALSGMRDTLSTIADHARATLDDPALQQAATRVGKKGGYKALPQATHAALGTLIGRTGDLDEAILAIDKRLAALARRVQTGPELRAAWGDPTERLADYLASPAMSEFRKRAQRAAYTKDGVKVGDDPDLARAALHDLAADQITDMRNLLSGPDGVPIPTLVQRIRATGRAPTADFLERIPAGERPEHAIGKTWTPVLPDTSTAETIKAGLRSLTRVPYRMVVEEPINKLSRSPIFLTNLIQARRGLAGYADRLVDQGMPRAGAERIARSTAAEQAYHASVRQIDDPQLRTQMDVIGRNFFTFSRATQDFARRWGRTMREDPTRLRRAQLAVEGGVHSGFVTKDDQGNLQFTYPGSGAAINAILSLGKALHIPGIVALPVQPNLSTKLIYLNAGLDNPIGFTVSPLVSTPVGLLEHLVPGHNLGKADLDVAMRGQLGAGRPLWEALLPTQLRRMWAAAGSDERNSQMASVVRNAIVHLDAAGQLPPADATPPERDAYLAKLQTAAHNHLFARAVFAFFAPGAPGSPEENTDSDAADPFYRAQGIASLKDEFRKMVGDLGYGQALAVWTKLHPDKLAFTVGTTQTAGQSLELPATRGAQQWMQDHAELLHKYGNVAAYLIPSDPGEFSQQAWQAQLEMGLRDKKPIDQMYADVRVRGAEREYYDSLDSRDAAIAKALAVGDTDRAKAIKAGFTVWSEQFQAANPLFAAKQADYAGRTVRATEALTTIREMLGDPATPALPELGGLQDMVDAYAAHQRFVAGMKGQRGDDAKARRSGESVAFGEYMTGLVGQYPGLRDLYNGTFRQLDNDLEYLTGEAA